MRWFKHLIESGDDPDIGAIENEFGFKGYYMFFRILEIMSKEFSVENPGENTFNFQWFLGRFSRKIDRKMMIKFLDFTSKKERIFYNLNDKEIWLKCPKLKELTDNYTVRILRSKSEVTTDLKGSNSEKNTSHRNKKKEVRNKNGIKDIYREIRHEVIKYLNEKTGKNFDMDNDTVIKLINGRLSDKNPTTLKELKFVIDVKASQWLDSSEYNRNLRPSTLFRKSNFENYRNEILPKRRPQVGENIHEITKREIEYNEARVRKLLEIDKELADEVKKAKKAKDIDKLEELENIRKEKIAAFSQEYSAREE